MPIFMLVGFGTDEAGEEGFAIQRDDAGDVIYESVFEFVVRRARENNCFSDSHVYVFNPCERQLRLYWANPIAVTLSGPPPVGVNLNRQLANNLWSDAECRFIENDKCQKSYVTYSETMKQVTTTVT
jgi:hypothetical protein